MVKWCHAEHLYMNAYGDTGNTLKWFFYGREATSGGRGLLEVILDKLSGKLTVTVKGEDTSVTTAVMHTIRTVLRDNLGAV